MADPITIRKLNAEEAEAAVPALTDVLMDCVLGGASVSFMAGVTRERLAGFWRGVAEAIRNDDRVLLVAEAGGVIVGTVQLVPCAIDNQPHRADVAKMLVTRASRGAGVGAALMTAVEAEARAVGRSLLTLDTVPTARATGSIGAWAGPSSASSPTTPSFQTVRPRPRPSSTRCCEAAANRRDRLVFRQIGLIRLVLCDGAVMVSTLDNSVRVTVDGFDYRLALSETGEVVGVYRLDHRPNGTGQRALKLDGPRARDIIAFHRESGSPALENLLDCLMKPNRAAP